MRYNQGMSVDEIGTPKKVRAEVTDASQSAEKKLGRFGLPIGWAEIASMAGLEKIRERGQGVIKPVLSDSLQELRRLGNKDIFQPFAGIYQDSQHDWNHLRQTMESKIGAFNALFPKGLRVLGTDNFIKWEEILKYELWVMRNLRTTLYTLHGRGGIAAADAVAIFSGVSGGNALIQSIPDEENLKWLKENGKLKEQG